MRVDSLCVYTDGSITVYDCYNCCTLLVSPFTCVYTVVLYLLLLQDLVNRLSTSASTLNGKFPHSMLLYYAIELLDIVGTLHSCGIIHADIKPDNILLRDIRYSIYTYGMVGLRSGLLCNILFIFYFINFCY